MMFNSNDDRKKFHIERNRVHLQYAIETFENGQEFEELLGYLDDGILSIRESYVIVEYATGVAESAAAEKFREMTAKARRKVKFNKWLENREDK